MSFGGASFDSFFSLWYQPVGFLGCGLATLWRAASVREERMPWALLGSGLVLYAAGSVYFNLEYGSNPSPPFPSLADGLWLALYPLCFAAAALLVRRRFRHVGITVWLDGVIGATVVAALAAAVVFEPVFALTVDNGAASVAQLAYPLGDMICMGFIVIVLGLSDRRRATFWALLGSGFALLAVGDSVYVVEAARGEWAPGGLLDLPYAVGTILLAAAAWAAPQDDHVVADVAPSRVLPPAVFAMAAVGLTGYGVVENLNVVASTLTLLALLAVVSRFGLTLRWLTRQRIDLAAQAATDPLTGLANHQRLHERLAQEVERGRREGTAVSVVALDIDHFKAINDTYGHSEGDVALQAIAKVLSAQARPYDLVGRIGGEEFALVLPGVHPAGAHAIAERCRRSLTELAVHGAGVSCSAGVASYPQRTTPEGHRLLELADGALYWAKRSGRAQVRTYDPSEVILLSGAEQHAQVREVLDSASALTPVFQPIVELATGRIGGYEALTRFPHTEPVRPPDLWFAQARRCGLGPALEARAIAVSLAVPDRPDGTFLSLNVSPAALLSPEVASVLPRDLSEIVIELTEDELFASDEALDAHLAALRARGARIAVDDAGAGYAGLQQLIRIRPDILKLDRSLVSGVHTDGSKIALLEALSTFATTTGAAVCGEGIEHVEELRMLSRFDVTYAQGYVLARPAPAWPGIATEVAGEVTSKAQWGMRLAAPPATGEGAVSLGQVTGALARVRSREDLNMAVRLIEQLTHSDAVVVSRVLRAERCVQTLSEHDWSPTGERFSYEEYPTTGSVIVNQALGQVIQGDPAADPAELRVLDRDGFGAVLLAPVVVRAETVGLIELYRRTAQPWTTTEIDRARVLAHQLGSVIRLFSYAAGSDKPPAALVAP